MPNYPLGGVKIIVQSLYSAAVTLMGISGAALFVLLIGIFVAGLFVLLNVSFGPLQYAIQADLRTFLLM